MSQTETGHLSSGVLLLPADAQILADCAIGAPLSMAPDEKSLYNSNKLFVLLYLQPNQSFRIVKGEVCWQPVVTRLFGLLTTGCHQQNVWWQPVVTSKMSGDNLLSPAKSLLTTSCILFNYNMYPIKQYQAFNDILCYKLFFYSSCLNIEICIQKNMHLCICSNDIKFQLYNAWLLLVNWLIMIKGTILLTFIKWNHPVDYLDTYSLFIIKVNKYPLPGQTLSVPLRIHVDPWLICLWKLFLVKY